MSNGTGAPPAGWYADPAGSAGVRYWDGSSWTAHVAAPTGAAPPGSILPAATTAPAAASSSATWIIIVGAVVGGFFLIAILAAIAIPTFLGAQERAQDRAAQSNLRNALTAAKVIYTDARTYRAANPDSLSGVEPSLTYTTEESADPTDISVYAVDQRITMAVRSDSGTCWVVDEQVAPGQVPGVPAALRTGRLFEGQLCHAAVGGGGIIPEDF